MKREEGMETRRVDEGIEHAENRPDMAVLGSFWIVNIFGGEFNLYRKNKAY